MPGSKGRSPLAPWDFASAMAVACLIAYVIAIHALFPFVGRDNDLLGGVWAVITTVFVFRETRHDSLSAGTGRLIATCVSPALCLPYLLLFPFKPVGMAILPGIGTVVIMLLGRRGDIITTAITTVVVMAVAALSPDDAWQQPLQRLVDTVVGIAVGVACRWIASSLFYGFIGEQPR